MKNPTFTYAVIVGNLTNNGIKKQNWNVMFTGDM